MDCNGGCWNLVEEMGSPFCQPKSVYVEIVGVRFVYRKACWSFVEVREVWGVHFDCIKACLKLVGVRKVRFALARYACAQLRTLNCMLHKAILCGLVVVACWLNG